MSERDNNKPTLDLSKIDRRDFLRFLSGGALALTSGGLLAGCGGVGNGKFPTASGTIDSGPTDQSIIFSNTQQATSAGVSITDTVRSIKLIVPPSAVQNPMNITLRVHNKQRDGVAPTGFTSNPNAIDFAIDPASLASKSTIQVEIPAIGPYDSFGSMAFVTDDKGNYLPLAISYDSTRNVLICSVTKEELQQIASTLQSSHAKQLHSHLSLPNSFFGIFTSLVAPVVSDANMNNFYQYDIAKSDWGPIIANPIVTGKRIALVIHGIFNDHANVKDLGGFLASDIVLKSNLPTGTYDQVWCYEYEWAANIADNGKLLAKQLNNKMPDATQIDIFAHSMGGLVSRWALEKEGIGSRITRLITLGTPHEGVPLQVAQFLVWLTAQKTGVNVASFIPGIDDLVALQFENPFSPSFLKQLNSSSSPYKTSAQYFTLAGTNPALIEDGFDIGDKINGYYNILNFLSPGSPIQDDGIVPVYSAMNSPVLNDKSDAWAHDQANHTASVSLTHDQIKGDDDPNKQSEMTDIVSKWIVEPIGVTIK